MLGILIGDAWLWFALELFLKATLLLAAAGGLTWLARKASAALRHRIWTLAFAALLLLPLANLALPGLTWRVIPRDWRAERGEAARRESAPPPAAPQATLQLVPKGDEPVPAATMSTERTEDVEGTHKSTPIAVSPDSLKLIPRSAGQTADRADAEPSLPVRFSIDWWLAIWLAGAVIVMAPLATGIVGNVLLKTRARRLATSDWQQLADDLSSRLSLRRKVTLLAGAAGQMPMTFGWLRPCVVLPPDAETWTAERREMVLVHELAHVKRYDVPLQIIARLACAVYWFHPLAWWAVRQMRQEREHACDDCVLAAGQRASRYASELLEIARAHHGPSPLATAALSMARRSQLEGRLLAVLDANRKRGPLGAWRSVALLLSAVVAVTAIGIVRPAPQLDSAAVAADTKTARPSKGDTGPSDDQRVLRGVVFSHDGSAPIADARIEVVAMDRNDGWPIYRPIAQKIDYQEATTDRFGRFEVALSDPILAHFSAFWVYASADNLGVHQHWVERGTFPKKRLSINLSPRQTLRVQLIDTIGNPIAGLEPQVWSTTVEGGGSLWLSDFEARALSKLWPACQPTDADGYTSLELAQGTTRVALLVDDERFGSQIVHFEPSDEPISVVLQPGQFVTGKVIAADTRTPLEGVQLTLLEQPYRKVRTSADGTFRLPTAVPAVDLYRFREIKLNVYPPEQSAYLFQYVHKDRPREPGEIEIPIKLSRGAVVEGVVREKGSGLPVPGARISMVQQSRNNAYYRRNSHASYVGTHMHYGTDVEGRFRMPLWFGPGFLLVQTDSPDFVPVMVSGGEKWDGKPGLERDYHAGALKVNLKPGDPPGPLVIELERGVTLRRKVVLPNGEPADCQAYSRSYLLGKTDVGSWLPRIPITDGVLELPGFQPAASNPLFLIDFENHCGAVVSPNESETDLNSPPVRLKPCGSARFRFLAEDEKPLAGYEPSLNLIVTPGAANTHHTESGQPLWCDALMWQNVARPVKIPKTDAEGRVTVEDLIPDATYRLQYVGKDNGWTDGYEFTVRSSKTVDVGDVVIPQHE